MKRNGHGLFIRLAVLLLAVLLVPVLASNGLAAQEMAATDPECYEHGDVNGDGVVDSRDAVQILYHSVFDGETETYPVNQDCDFDGDGKVDRKDALYILYGSFHLSQYPLDGQVHQFYAPEWKWTADDQVEVIFKCGCGQSHSFTQDDGVTLTSEQTAQKTCLSNGEVVYTATVNFGGEEITDTRVVVIPATGHEMVGTQSCELGSKCANCDYEVKPLGHSWQADPENSVAATCVTNATEAFKCGVCGETKTIPVEGLKPHNFVYVEDTTVSGCTKAKLYRCDVCGEEQTSDEYTTHTYVASIECEATCALEGTKKYTCSCGDSYTEAIPTNNAHMWDAGVTADGITTYTCASCSATKTAVVVTEGNTATVSKEALQDTEVQVNNAAIKLDQETLEELGEEVKIDVAVVDTAEVVLDEELKAQIGDNPVYDFSLSSDETQVSQFAGEITISLPYTLQEGDDVDCIDVWFINDDGEVECVMGTYAGGQVTFTTDHFSYYTVTRLTPKQRCEHYGHLYNYKYKAATCTTAGYDIQSCKRCGDEVHEVLPMLEHKFIETVQKATCEEDGVITKQCPVCKQKVTNDLPALGHNWVKDVAQSKDATCHAAGYEVFVCDGCGESYRNDLAQLEHVYEIEDEKDPDCTTHGHKKERCILCGEKKSQNTQAPTGHDFTAENAVWEWAEDYSSATVTLVCAYDKNHTKTLTAVVGREMDDGKTCSSKITYKAVASFNKAEFVDYQAIDLGYVSHTPGTEWLHNANQHYHQCQVCKEYVEATKHNWDAGTVVTEPTCAEEGLREYKCTVCNATKEETISATGEHNYVDNVCTGCGLVENTCTHSVLSHLITIDNAKWGICEDTIIEFRTCDCGEYTGFVRREGCVSKHMGTETVVTNAGEFELDVYQCIYCGLTHKTGHYEKLDEENCITTWYEIYALYMEDELIAIDYNVMVPNGQPVANEHMQTNQRIIDLAEYGMCGDVLFEVSCHCGKYTHAYREETECVWETMATDDENVTKQYCSVCGTTYTETFVPKQEGCWWNNSRVHTYERDGEVLYSYTVAWSINVCEYETTDIEYINGDCENGVIVYLKCINCGEEDNETWFGSHPHVNREEILIEGEGICYNTVIRSSCPCGESVNLDYVTSCSIDYNDTYVNENVYKYRCMDCGLTRTESRTYGEKDENCYGYENVTFTYTDANGNVLMEVEGANYGAYHDVAPTYELVEGASTCVDGVTETYRCKDCGLVTQSYTYYYHRTYSDTTYEGADYGMCGGKFSIDSCACGAIGGIGEHDMECVWTQTENGYYCPNCNTFKDYYTFHETGRDGCKVERYQEATFHRNGEIVLQFQREADYNEHRTYYVAELLGKTCADGYRLYERCADCDYNEDHGVQTSNGYWTLGRKIISQGKLCGDLEEITTGCACGENKETHLEFRNGSCTYGETFEVNGAWISRCTKCGVEQVIRNDYEPGTTECETRTTATYTYRKNGVNLFSHVIRNVQNSHTYVYSFDLYGKTCDEGYDLKGTCIKCGHTSNFGRYYGCNTWITDIQTLKLGEGGCGNAEIQKFSCACGENSYTSVNEMCYLEWQSSEDGTAHWKCWNCGLDKYVTYENEVVPNSCERKTISTYRYLRDGEEIAEYVDEDVYYQHIYVATFSMDGETCQDGYSYTEACMYCGKVNNSGYMYGHSAHTTEVVDLAQMGMCSGYFYKSSCPCGEIENWYLYPNCADMDPGCSTCGTSYKVSKEAQRDAENCRIGVTTTYTFTRDGEVFYTFVDEKWETMHDEVVTFTMHNPESDCSDGVDVTVTCNNCDYTYATTVYDHATFEKEYLFLNDVDEDICSGYLVMQQCACGKDKRTDGTSVSCEFQYTGFYSGTDEQGNYISGNLYQCQICGLERIDLSYSVSDPDHCKCYNYGKNIYRKGETVIAETDRLESWSDQHANLNVELTLVDGARSCYDGVLRKETCECGYVNEYYLYHHDTRNVEVIDLTQYGLCRGKLVHDVCACGENDNWGVYDSCGGCGTCGLTFSEDASLGSVFDKETCAYISKTTYRITNGDEVVFEKIVDRITGYNHNYITTFELMGETCMDGYYYTQVCAFCGKEGDSGYDCHNHSYYKTEIVETPLYDQSTEYHIWKESCPCGANVRWNLAPYPGEYTHSQTVQYDTENCRKLTFDTYTFFENGEEILTFTGEGWEPMHEEVAEFTLYDPKAGCEGGYAVTLTCRNCGKVSYADGYDHSTYPVDYLYMDDVDEAICDGYLAIMECACGKNDFIHPSLSCNRSYNWEEICDGHYGSIYRCETCGLEEVNYDFSAVDVDNCVENYYNKILYRRNGEVLAECDVFHYSNERHTEKVTFRLFDEAAGCEGGFEVTRTCRVCGVSNTYEDNTHTMYEVEQLYLDQVDGNVCDGKITKQVCPCGKYQYFSEDIGCSFMSEEYESYTDSQGIEHSIWTYGCEYCDMELEQDWFAIVDEVNCTEYGYLSETYRLGNEVLIERETLNSWGAHHTYESQYSLVDGTNCEQGVIETGTCKYCGEIQQSEHYYHVYIPVETIDLQQYGAVCNTQFVRMQCLCGQNRYNEFVGKDKCDMYQEGIESWITDAVVDGQETTEGWIWLSNDAWIYTCAVTDPQCAFKIRNASYYKVENCVATRYETWQFGYNPEDGTCAYEFTFATGEKHAFHNYADTHETQTVDETTYKEIFTSTCTLCQSTYTQTITYVDNNHYSTEYVAVNTLNNGENQYRRHYYEYGFRYEDNAYETVSLNEYTYADGSEYWYRHDYTYDLPDSCTRTSIYTDSVGGHSVNSEEFHAERYQYREDKEATCTQFGMYTDLWYCICCGKTTSEYSYPIEPTCHSWMQEEETGIYICGYCGLQNINGASGTIVMEDMTDSYGEGLNYVVGYWNRGDLSAHKYVSVVLKDAEEGAEDELILDGITFTELNADTDGITAITFSQADTAAAALAAMEAAGYTGDYAIRFTFVPTDAGDTLDYAITFDSLSA